MIIKRILLFLVLLLASICVQGQAVPVDPCIAKVGAGFTVWGSYTFSIPPNVVAVPFMCADLLGNLVPVKPVFFTNGFSQSRTVMPSAVGNAHKSDGITVVPDAVTRTVTLDMANATMQGISVVAMYTIKDEACTAAVGAHSITVQAAVGTIDVSNPVASTTITVPCGAKSYYCTSTNCFTTK